MKLDYLATFLAAAEDLNFTHAGRRLHLSQSAVSQQIKELEDDLGVSLFERRGRGLILTPAGEALRAKARPILRDVRVAREAVSGLGDQAQGVVHVGAAHTPGIYLLPQALGAFAKAFPGVRISLRIADGASLVRGMQDGDLDLALLQDQAPAGRLPGWEQAPLLQDELVLIAPPDHPWARRGPLDPQALPGTPLIFRRSDSPTRQLILARIAGLGLDPERLVTLFELDNTEAIKRAVMAGLGCGWVSRYACTLEREAGWLAEVPVAGLLVDRPLWLVSRPADQRSAAQQALIALLRGDAWLPPSVAAAAEASAAPGRG